LTSDETNCQIPGNADDDGKIMWGKAVVKIKLLSFYNSIAQKILNHNGFVKYKADQVLTKQPKSHHLLLVTCISVLKETCSHLA